MNVSKEKSKIRNIITIITIITIAVIVVCSRPYG